MKYQSMSHVKWWSSQGCCVHKHKVVESQVTRTERLFLTGRNFQQISIFVQSATLKHRSIRLQIVPRVFKPSLLNNLVMSFTMQPFLVFTGNVPSFILRRACLILNTVPPLMSPCGSLRAVKCKPRSLWRTLPHSLHSPSLRMSSSLAALCSPPRSLLLSAVDWGGDRGETAPAPQRHATDCTKGWENLFVSLPFTSISPCLISLRSYEVIPLKIVSGFAGVFFEQVWQNLSDVVIFLSVNESIHSLKEAMCCILILIHFSRDQPKGICNSEKGQL